MIGTLNIQETDDFLHSQIIGRIGCHADNITYVVPISYVYDGAYIYCHTHEGLKTEMMRKNPEVCFEVDAIHDMANWQSVICWGKFEEVTDAEERVKGIKKLAGRSLPLVASKTVKLFSEYPFYPDDLNELEGIVFRIRIEKISGKFEKLEYAGHRLV